MFLLTRCICSYQNSTMHSSVICWMAFCALFVLLFVLTVCFVFIQCYLMLFNVYDISENTAQSAIEPTLTALNSCHIHTE